MDAGRAIEIAKLLEAGKMIGGDEDEVRNALLGEIDRLRTALMFIATAYYSAPEVLREAAREAYEAVPNAEVSRGAHAQAKTNEA